MSEFRPSEVLNPPRQFIRSINLERDFEDPRALDGYILTPHLRESLQRVLAGLEPGSTRRAWRVTGDYGSGKSSFGVALSRLVAAEPGTLPAALEALRTKLPEGTLLPVLVTGSRERIAGAVLRGLKRSLERVSRGVGRTPQVLKSVEDAMGRAEAGAQQSEIDTAAINLLGEAAEYLTRSGRGAGVVVVLDELGKFLEHAALNPSSQDVYFLQRLGEAAARSGAKPVFVVGFLHQAFSAYAETLTDSAQKEWVKVADRYEELLFDHPLEHTAQLVAGALGVRKDRLSDQIVQAARSAMEASIDLGWYGPAPARHILVDLAPLLYPLHPSVLPVLSRLLGRFGQSERSVFSFLLSHEPAGLQSFAAREMSAREAEDNAFFRLPHLFDYVRTALGHRLGAQSYRSHWLEIAATVDAIRPDAQAELDVVKTVGILNLLNAHDLLATKEAIGAALDTGGHQRDEVVQAITALRNGRRVLHDRGAAGGLALWPHTSVSLDRALDTARGALGQVGKIAPYLERQLDTRPLVARRHYIETGNLRYFEVRHAAAARLEQALREPTTADGLILVVLPETRAEREAALEFVRTNPQQGEHGTTLILVPSPLAGLSGVVEQVRLWEWVAANTPELNHDRYAAEEVERQLATARAILAERMRDSFGLHYSTQPVGTVWFRGGQEITPPTGRGLLRYLSELCGEVYPSAPRLHNELINRAALSSSASGARMRLIERILEHAEEPLLGLPETKAPPEKSMYLSILQAGGVHTACGGIWGIHTPKDAADPLQLRPALREIAEVLESAPDGRAAVEAIYEALRQPPFGMREGLLPLILAIFIKAHESEIALYERGTFLRHVGGVEFLRVVKAPDLFDLQFYRVAGIRTELFEHLLTAIKSPGPGNRPVHLLDVVTPLVTIVAELQEFALQTKNLSVVAQNVRAAILESREPGTLVFRQLPEACGLEPFSADEELDSERLSAFKSTLRAALEDLRAAYPDLRRRIQAELFSAFGYLPDHPGARGQLRGRAENLLGAGIHEPRLRALCTRLSDEILTDEGWLTAIGSAVRERPPTRWTDDDTERFTGEIRLLAKRFREVEAMVGPGGATKGLRVAITRPDGRVAAELVHFDSDDEASIVAIQEQLAAILQGAPHKAALIAASRALLPLLQQEEQDDEDSRAAAIL